MLAVVLLWCGAMAFGQDVDNGALLAGLGGCESCHVTPEGQAYGGGYGIKTSFGTYYGSNISPDRETGIGDWTVDDFIVAMRRGRSPDSGRPYVPAFPYASFTGLSDSDLRDLYAYLMTQEPVSRVSDDHEVPWLYKSRLGIGWWRGRGFRQGPYEVNTERSQSWNRGAYLTDVVGHCGECHTPRTRIGVVRDRYYLAGGSMPPEKGPNITPHETALEEWSVSDWEDFLEMGMTPDGNFVGGEMGRLVDHGTARLSDEDRAAMAEYLRSVPGVSLGE